MLCMATIYPVATYVAHSLSHVSAQKECPHDDGFVRLPDTYTSWCDRRGRAANQRTRPLADLLSFAHVSTITFTARLTPPHQSRGASVAPGRIALVDTNRPDTAATHETEIETTPRNPKTSYESNADVQRWLREQESARAGTKPPFNPTFLAHQRDRPWVLSSLATFYEDDLITDVLAVVKSGKEATVYCCAAHPSTGLEYVAAKVYRPRMFRSLRNDAVYRASRPQVDARGREGHGAHRWNATAKETERGRASMVSAWIRYEYETQRLLYDAGADAPRPLAQSGNAMLMEYVGGGPGAPAPLLREVALTREEAQPLFERVLRNIELWLACDRVHGDLSAYNMLYWEGADHHHRLRPGGGPPLQSRRGRTAGARYRPRLPVFRPFWRRGRCVRAGERSVAALPACRTVVIFQVATVGTRRPSPPAPPLKGRGARAARTRVAIRHNGGSGPPPVGEGGRRPGEVLRHPRTSPPAPLLRGEGRSDAEPEPELAFRRPRWSPDPSPA